METALIKIDRLALEGDGVGRLPATPQDKGKVAFVPYSLPNEQILCHKIEEKRNYSRWLPSKIELASTFRQQPLCALHFTPEKDGIWCGGCDWQHIKIEEQRRWKRELVCETLARLGGLVNPPVGEIIFSPDIFRYRNKVQIPFAPSGSGFAAGFYAPGSHQVIEFDDCVVQPELSIKVFRAVKKVAQTKRWEPYNKDRNHGWLRHLLIRTNSIGEALVALVTRFVRFNDGGAFVESLRADCPEVVGISQNVQPEQTNVILGERWKHLWGQPRLKEKICGLDIYFSPGAFMQVNTAAAELLYEKSLELSGAGPGWTALDLYSGVGVMTLMAARRMKKAIGVEEVTVSVEDAIFNAKKNQVSNVSFLKSSVEEYFRKNFGSSSLPLNPERLLVIVDPPRAGCKPEVTNRLLEIEPARLVYVSCDPSTLARDLKLLCRKYTVLKVCPVDLFPQTSHVETIVSLQRKWN